MMDPDFQKEKTHTHTNTMVSLKLLDLQSQAVLSLYSLLLPFKLYLFIPHHFKKCGVLCYTLRSKTCVRECVPPSVCLSVCTYVCPSALRFHSLPGAILAHLSRRLIGELIGYSWSVRPSSTMLKDLLLQNCLANQSQILCGAPLGRGNESLFAASGSHDQDGHNAHIYIW